MSKLIIKKHTCKYCKDVLNNIKITYIFNLEYQGKQLYYLICDKCKKKNIITLKRTRILFYEKEKSIKKEDIFYYLKSLMEQNRMKVNNEVFKMKALKKFKSLTI